MSRKPRCFYGCDCGHRFRAAVVRGLDQVRCAACGKRCGSSHISAPLPRGGVVTPRHLSERDKIRAGLALGDAVLDAGSDAAPAPFPSAPIAPIAHIDPSTLVEAVILPTVPSGAPQTATGGGRRTREQERSIRDWYALNPGVEPSATLQAWERLLPWSGTSMWGRGERTVSRRDLPALGNSADVQRGQPLPAVIIDQSRRLGLEADALAAARRVVVAWRGHATAGGWTVSENLRALARHLDALDDLTACGS